VKDTSNVNLMMNVTVSEVHRFQYKIDRISSSTGVVH